MSPNKKYFCTKCGALLFFMTVKVNMVVDQRKIFYCENNKCSHFGLCTVVAKSHA